MVHCIDFRFREFLNTHLAGRFPGGYDVIAWAGGAKDIAERGTESGIAEQLKLSHALHAPSVVCLIQHEDCGAYGGSAALGEGERMFQRQQLMNAKEAVLRMLPGIAVETLFVTLDGRMEEAA